MGLEDDAVLGRIVRLGRLGRSHVTAGSTAIALVLLHRAVTVLLDTTVLEERHLRLRLIE